MPDGQVIFCNAGQYPQAATNAVLNALIALIDGQVTTTGVWVQLYPFVSGSLDVTSSSGSLYSVQVYGSNQDTMPDSSFTGDTLGGAITTDALSFVTYPVRWIKAALSLTQRTTTTVGGTPTSGDSVVIRFSNVAFVGGHIDISFSVGMTTTLAQIASGLATAVNANITLSGDGITAHYTSGTSLEIRQTGPTIATLSNQSSGGATETLTFSFIVDAVSALLNVTAA
jgi:hypothetical protein